MMSRMGIPVEGIALFFSQAEAYPLSAKLDTCPEQSEHNGQTVSDGKGHPQPYQAEYAGQD